MNSKQYWPNSDGYFMSQSLDAPKFLSCLRLGRCSETWPTKLARVFVRDAEQWQPQSPASFLLNSDLKHRTQKLVQHGVRPVLDFDTMNINESMIEDARSRNTLLPKLLSGELRVPAKLKEAVA